MINDIDSLMIDLIGAGIPETIISQVRLENEKEGIYQLNLSACMWSAPDLLEAAGFIIEHKSFGPAFFPLALMFGAKPAQAWTKVQFRRPAAPAAEPPFFPLDLLMASRHLKEYAQEWMTPPSCDPDRERLILSLAEACKWFADEGWPAYMAELAQAQDASKNWWRIMDQVKAQGETDPEYRRAWEIMMTMRGAQREK